MREKHPYFPYYCTEGIDNELHVAAFEGDIENVKKFLSTASISLYQPTKYKSTALALAVCRDHTEIIDLFLNIYKADLNSVSKYLKINDIKQKGTFEFHDNYVVAMGTQQIEKVKHELNEFICNPAQLAIDDDEMFYKNNYNVILMKEINSSEPEIMFLKPRNISDRTKLLKIVCELIGKNGICSINHGIDYDMKTVVHLAAMVGDSDLVMKLMDLGGDAYRSTSWDRTVVGSSSTFDTFMQMCNRLNLDPFQINYYFEFGASSESVFSYIEYLTKQRVERFSEIREDALTNVLSMNQVVTIFKYHEVYQKCFEKFHNVINDREILWKILNQIIECCSGRNLPVFVKILEKHEPFIEQEEWGSMFYKLVRYGWTDAVKETYQKFPRLKELQFQSIEAIEAILQAIHSNKVDLVNFLMDHYKDDFNDPKIFLLHASGVYSEDHTLLRRILHGTDPNIVVEGNYHENCLLAALKTYNYENYRIIMDSGRIGDVNKIRSTQGENVFNALLYPSRYINSLESMNIWEIEEPKRELPPGFRQLSTEREKWKKGERKSDQLVGIFNELHQIGGDVFVEKSNKEGLLHDAVKADNIIVVEKLLDLGLDRNKCDVDGNQPIHCVRTFRMMRLLTSKLSSKELNSKNNFGNTLLHQIINLGNYEEMFEELMRHDVNVNVNEANNDGNTIFHSAPTAEFCGILLKYGANPKFVNKSRETPLYHALYSRRISTALFLLQQPNMDLCALNTRNESYLILLAQMKQFHLQKIQNALELHSDFQLLCAKHCNDCIDNVGLLYHACANNEFIPKALLRQPNLEINVVSTTLDTPLHVVSTAEIAGLLIERGANVNAINVNNETPLHSHVRKCENVELIDILLKAGALVNLQGKSMSSSLHIACANDNIEFVGRLLNFGADIYLTDAQGKTPFNYLSVENKSIVERVLN